MELISLFINMFYAAQIAVDNHFNYFNRLPSRDPYRLRVEEGLARFGICLTVDRIHYELKISHQAAHAARPYTSDAQSVGLPGSCWIGFASWSNMTACLDNLAAIVEKANVYLEGNAFSEKRFVIGWIRCFIVEALYADSDREQELCARALAKEAENPRQTSLIFNDP